MDSKLSQLSQLKKRLDIALNNYQRNHALWAKWLHFARKQDWYDNWAYEQAMRQSDLKADHRDIAQRFQTVEPEYKETFGAIYWSERHSFHAELDQLRLLRSKLLHDLWTEKTEEGKWAYSLRQIAQAYGNTDDAMYKKLKVNEWFQARKTPGQKVISINSRKDLR